MKLLCKLTFHKYKIVKMFSLREGKYPRYLEQCERCGKKVVATYDVVVKPFVIERSDFDDSENV